MAQTRRTAQRAEIVTSGLDSGQDIVSGPTTRWMPGDNIDFPIERLARHRRKRTAKGRKVVREGVCVHAMSGDARLHI